MWRSWIGRRRMRLCVGWGGVGWWVRGSNDNNIIKLVRINSWGWVGGGRGRVVTFVQRECKGTVPQWIPTRGHIPKIVCVLVGWLLICGNIFVHCYLHYTSTFPNKNNKDTTKDKHIYKYGHVSLWIFSCTKKIDLL